MELHCVFPAFKLEVRKSAIYDGAGLIILINQVHHQCYHYRLVLRLALGNEQREGHQRIIG